MALAPKFSIRQLLGLMVGLAVIFAGAAAAYRGSMVAFGLIVGVIALIVPAVMVTIVYWISLGIALATRNVFSRRDASKKLGCWMGLGVMLFSAGQVAGQGTSIPAGKSGYAVTIDNDYPHSDVGYRPVRVTLETVPKRAVTRDLEFTVVIKSDAYNQSDQTLTAPLILPTGQSSATIEVYLSASRGNNFRNQEIIIERGPGNQRYESRNDLYAGQIGQNYFNAGLQLGTLFISSSLGKDGGLRTEVYDGRILQPTSFYHNSPASLPTLHLMQNVFVTNNVNAGVQGSDPVSAIANDPQIHGCHPDDLPTSWIGLSCLEEILVSLDDLKDISRADDRRRMALEQWTAAGGSLIVFGVDQSFADVNDILPLLLGKERTSERISPPLDWRDPVGKFSKLRRLRTKSKMRNQNYDEDAVVVDLADTQFDETNWSQRWSSVIEPNSGTKSKPNFLLGRYVNGRIVAVAGDMATWPEPYWVELNNALQMIGLPLGSRLGTTDDVDSVAGLSVPGVGEPPLIAFQVLISVFIFTAGPVMYWLLSRTRQLQLLFLLVPLLSLSACLGLVGYAVFVDGFQAWGRVQSVTWVDHSCGSAVSQARCSYYCGTQPKPYRYGVDTLVLPVEDDKAFRRSIRQTPTSMAFSGGKIQPRTPHQIVTVRSFEMLERLDWKPPRKTVPSSNPVVAETVDVKTDDGSPSTANARDAGVWQNRLGANVVYAVARTDNGWVAVENLPADETLPAKTTDPIEVNQRLSRLAADLSPVFDTRSYQYGVATNYVTSGANTPGAEFDLINQLRALEGSGVLTEPNTYIAILESFPGLENQMENVNYKKQLHVIFGKW